MSQNEYFKQFTDEKTFNKLVHLQTMTEFMSHLKQFKEWVAVVDNEEVTYEKLISDCLGIGYILKENRVAKGKNVGIFSLNDYDFIKATVGTMAYGAVATLLPAQLDEMGLIGLCLQYQLEVLFYSKQLEEKVLFVEDKLPQVRFVLIRESKHQLDSFNQTIKPNDPACIVLTSGTTGKHKGAVLSHKALLTGVRNGALGMKSPFHEVYVSVIPYTHVFGLIRNVLTGLYTGSKVYTTPDMRQLFKRIKEANPTILVIVPALAELFLKLIRETSIGILGNRIQTMIVGGAHVSPYLTVEFNKLGIYFCPGYGLTESANLVSGNPEPTKNPSSVGQFYPYQEYRIVNGELQIKGDNLMIEYYNDPEETKLAYDDGYFKTGDLVRVDDDGNLFITGRVKELIVLPNGENVSPAFLEGKINAFKTVQDSLVYEDTNEYGVVILTCELLPRMDEVKKLDISNLQQHFEEVIEMVNKTLYYHEQIAKVIVRTEDFKRTPSMKIIRPKKEIQK